MTLYIGVDIHARQQTLSYLDTEDGTTGQLELQHERDDVKGFYSKFQGEVIVGIEACGYTNWLQTASSHLSLCIGSGDTGNEDSDWFFTHYQPYRYILNRVPFYPTCGNHDADETEKSDDYTQMLDNFYIRQRFFSGNRDEGDAVKEHGLFYQFKFGKDVEFISIDSAKPKDGGDRAFMLPINRPFLNQVMPPVAGPPTTWRIPFFHHPPYVDGPTKKNAKDAETHLVKPIFEKAGVRLVFNGHEHNFQISAHNNIHYVLTGAAGDLREGKLRGQAKAHNIAWAAKYHFLLVEYQGGKMSITPYGELRQGELQPLTEVKKPGGQPFPLPLKISLS